MDFVVDNYVWFIVIGVVILMAIIGYIADKTDFGRKTKSEKSSKEFKKKNNKKEKKVTKIEIDAKGINELSQDVADKNYPKKDENIDNFLAEDTDTLKENNFDVSINNDLNQPSDQIMFENQGMNNFASNENIDQSLFAPLTNEEVNVNDVNSIPVGEENFNTVNEVIAEDIANQPEELQNIDSTILPGSNDNIGNDEKVSEEEDIWKF